MTQGECYAVRSESGKLPIAHKTHHGHDHIGNDRGAEEHPFLGFNYRISELNAAVGLAQLRRMDEFLHIQKRNYEILKSAIDDIPGVTFRKVPEGGEESYAFLNFYLPDEEKARRTAKALKEAGIDGCFYWFDNNWHYVKHWQHLKDGDSLYPIHETIKAELVKLKNRDFSQSDSWMGRNLSCLIKLSWRTQEVQERAVRMADIIRVNLI